MFIISYLDSYLGSKMSAMDNNQRSADRKSVV